MQSDALEIKKYLEESFDIPFVVSRRFENNEPFFTISPANRGNEFFDIRVTIRNSVRLIMEFVPQHYSANFIAGMGHQSRENQSIFLSYVRLISDKGAKSTIKVNGVNLDFGTPETWTDDWKLFEARITKMPVAADSASKSLELIKEWSSLMMGLILSLANIVSIDSDIDNGGFAEGACNRVEVNRYERNPLNRKLCLERNGYVCQICGMDFEKKYGDIGHHFIHVHHITPVSQIGEGYIIDPLSDLIPVCPNCHAMLHRTDPPLKPTELKERMEQTESSYRTIVQPVAKVATPHREYGKKNNN